MEERSIPMERWELFWGLSIVTLVYHRFRKKGPPFTVTELADLFNLEVKRIESVVQKLIARNILLEGKSLDLGFARDPADLTVGDVAGALLTEHLQQPPLLPSAHTKIIKGVLDKVQTGLAGEAGRVTIAQLAREYEEQMATENGLQKAEG